MLIEQPGAHYPVIVIGSGPAGMTVAHELIEAHGHDRVLMIESGAMDYDPEINRLSLVNATGDLADEYYATHSIRAFGGTSMVWAGWCAVLEAMAFNQGEWPFSHDSLMPFYRRAAHVLELPADSTQRIETPVRPGSTVRYRPFYLSPPVRFGAKYRAFAENSAALHVMLRTTVRHIEHADGRVTGVNIGGRRVSAERVVLACGGIGNPRLLLLSGLTADGQVGRYFMEHPHAFSYNEVVMTGAAVSSTQSVSGRRMNAFTLDEITLQDHGMRSFHISTGPQEDTGLIPNAGPAAVRAIMSVQAEMLPSADNRVTLADEADDLGQPRAAVSFRFNARDSLPALWRLAGERFLRENLGRFTAPRPVNDLTGGGHLMGTTRMGPPGQGCVDEFCELHSCRSLYVAGSSVFPAGGSANPTFTIVALSLKLADHLAENTPGKTPGKAP